jgi:hypothetical protein
MIVGFFFSFSCFVCFVNGPVLPCSLEYVLTRQKVEKKTNEWIEIGFSLEPSRPIGKRKNPPSQEERLFEKDECISSS